MKSYTVICFFLALAMVLLPLASVEKATDVISKELFNEEVTESTIEAEPVTEKPDTVRVMNAGSNNITELSLRDYLIGVIAEEMNASYNEEAIKAQVIAAHTKLEYTKLHKTDTLEDADITDSASTHQGYLTKTEQQEKWGESYEKNYEKIAKCVDEVIDLLIFYDNEPANALFYAISNGKTENASNVWGGNYPYLVSVDSSGDKLSPAYTSTVEITSDEFMKKISENGGKLGDRPEKWVEKITNTNTGMVKEITIGGKVFKGTEIRKLFNLKSSTFSVKYSDGVFVFTVCGYGHGVGMSQYGANYMAQQGKNYKEILKHYYKGVEIKEYK